MTCSVDISLTLPPCGFVPKMSLTTYLSLEHCCLQESSNIITHDLWFTSLDCQEFMNEYSEQCLSCICARFTSDPHFPSISSSLRASDSDDVEGTKMKDAAQQKIKIPGGKLRDWVLADHRTHLGEWKLGVMWMDLQHKRTHLGEWKFFQHKWQTILREHGINIILDLLLIAI